MKICTTCNGAFEEGIAYCPNDGVRLTTVSKIQNAGGSVPQAAVDAQAQEPPTEDLTGRVIAGRYQILRRLGEGGMGVVYAAVDTRLEKQVAIKVLREDFARRGDVVARFTQEAKSAARIKHENVLDVTDYGQTEDGSFYIAMELLVGTDLADVLQKAGTIDTARALNIMTQVTRALGAAHAKGIVHRDLKPENIFLVTADDGREVVKIVDFGIAQMKDLSGGSADSSKKLTRTGMIFGTPEYMSPEQASGKTIDHRVDVYAIGVILYEVFAGRVPFVGDTFMGVLTQHMFENPPEIRALKPDADVSPELEAVINKALAKDPAFRYQSMQELTDDLVRLRDGLRPSAADAVIPGAPIRPTFTRPRPAVGGATVPDTPGAKGASMPVGPVTQPVMGEPRRSRAGLVVGLVVGILAIGGVAGVAIARSQANQGGGASGGVTQGQAVGGQGAGGQQQQGGGANPNLALAGDAGAQEQQGGGVVARVQDAGDPAQANARTVDAGAAEGATVRVRVVTAPAGARVEVDGQDGAGCAATPCDLTLPRGREVHLRATAPRKRGERTFTPARDGEEITVELASIGGGGGGAVRQNTGGGGGGGGARARCRPGQMTYRDPRTGLFEPCP